MARKKVTETPTESNPPDLLAVLEAGILDAFRKLSEVDKIYILAASMVLAEQSPLAVSVAGDVRGTGARAFVHFHPEIMDKRPASNVIDFSRARRLRN
jgi:hypothetical protein